MRLPPQAFLWLCLGGPACGSPAVEPAVSANRPTISVGHEAPEVHAPAESAGTTRGSNVVDPLGEPSRHPNGHARHLSPNDSGGSLLPLSSADRAVLFAGDEDAPADVDITYVQSNETFHELFFPHVRGRGGAYVGVGSDQNYTIMAAAESEIAFLLDIDARVTELHRVYELLIRDSDDPEQLVARFAPDNEEATVAWLENALAQADTAARGRIVRGYRVARETVFRHLQRVRSRIRDGVGVTWLSDPIKYAHVRSMFVGGRVRPMIGDLTGNRTLATIARACRALGVDVRVVYLSNAEEYFRYTTGFRTNILDLPVTDDAVVLRTIYSKEWEHADLWAYQAQALSNFRQRLTDPKNRSRKPMLKYAERDGELVRVGGQKGMTLIGLDESEGS